MRAKLSILAIFLFFIACCVYDYYKRDNAWYEAPGDEVGSNGNATDLARTLRLTLNEMPAIYMCEERSGIHISLLATTGLGKNTSYTMGAALSWFKMVSLI